MGLIYFYSYQKSSSLFSCVLDATYFGFAATSIKLEAAVYVHCTAWLTGHVIDTMQVWSYILYIYERIDQSLNVYILLLSCGVVVRLEIWSRHGREAIGSVVRTYAYLRMFVLFTSLSEVLYRTCILMYVRTCRSTSWPCTLINGEYT